MKERVTMSTLARAAGVSVMTVSRALRDNPVLPLRTRQRLQRLAAKLGYRPDPTVGQLMARLRLSRRASPQILAWVTSHPSRDAWRASASHLAMFQGAKTRALAFGYRLEPFWLRAPGMSGPRLGEVLLHRDIRGLLVAPLPALGQLDLPWAHFATATCGFSLTGPALHRACSHQFHALRLAGDELAARGYQRVGLVLSATADERVDGMWLAGFLAQQRRLSPASRVPALVLPPSCQGARAQARFLRWFARQRPDALIGTHEIRRWLHEADVAVPRDCAFALINTVGHPDAGVDHHMDALGAAAADLVIEQLTVHHHGLPTIPKVVMVECRWQDGPSAPTRRLVGP